MALDTILAIVPMIVEYTFVPVKRHLSYAFNCRSKVEKLKNQVENLKNQRDGLKPHVDEATRRGDEIYANVRNWLTSVDEAIGEADDLVVDEEQARERCFLGLIPNLKKRYKLSKKVEKKAQTVAELREKCKFDLDRIACRPSLWQIVPPSVYNNEVLHSRISILEKVMNALRDPAFNMIGVYGLGGVGKTTLAKEVRRKAIEDKLFDVVLMVTVSETPELRKIQGTIADMLGLELKEETEEGRACRLRQRLLKEKKILVILDDIWEQLEPEKLGIPFGNDHKGCKIFLTSRREDILSRDMGTQESFELRVLSEAEAWSLFVTVVGDVTNQDLRSIASEVAKKCAGLPVLIVTVAGALKNRDLNEWNVALKELSKVDNEGIQSKVYATLKLSYNHLANEELKSFFLLCAQIAQSDIQIRDLLLYSMGLDLLRGKDTVADARNKVYKLVRDLKASCLLLDGDRNGSLKMHDVVRDTALDIASKSQHSFTFRDVVETKEWPNRDFRSCSRIALPSCEIHELPERLECPKLELLVLGRGSIHSKGPDLNISDIFFEGITKLKVLHFTGMCLRSLPPSLRYLTNLLTLCLDECVLRDASVIGELKRLEVLSFRRSMIEELPREIAHLTGLKLLDLSDCDKLKVIPANVISRLSLLEELYMRNSFGQWELQGLNSSNNASLAELKNLSRLTTLEIDVPDVEMLPKDLFSNKLERYDIVIGKKRHRYDEYLSSRRLRIWLNTDIHLDHGLALLLKKAEVLYLDNVKGIKSILYDMDREGFQRLKHLDIENSDDIQYIINSTVQVPSLNVFPILESLSLNNLVSLEKICYGRLTTGPFTKLRILKVGKCNRLKSLFSFFMVRNLSQLQEMTVSDCQNMEEIVIDQSGVGEDNIEVAEFSQLRSLKLIDLPLLKSFCIKVKESMSDEVHNPRPLFDKMVSFPNLEELYVSFIDMKYLFTTSFVKSLLRLKRLGIYNCGFMERIVLTVAEEERLDKIIFSHLENLTLWYLPNLTSFCDGHFIEFCSLTDLLIDNCPVFKTFVSNRLSQSLFDEKVSFPNLEKFYVESTGCQDLKYLFTTSFVKSLLRLKTLQICKCEFMERIVLTEEFAEEERLNKIIFSDLENLILSNLPNLTNFCDGHLIEFCSLTNLRIDDCPVFKTFISNRLSQSLFDEKVAFSSLEHLTIISMSNLERIWHNQLAGGSFCMLKSMTVGDCKNLHTLFPSNDLRRFQKLEKLNLTNCDSLEEIYQLLEFNAEEESFAIDLNLRSMEIRDLKNLKNLFPASVAQNLLLLEKLSVDSCGVETIVAKAEGAKAAPSFVFPKLLSLNLTNLQDIRRFYLGIHSLEFPRLKDLKVHDCGDGMEFCSELFSLQGKHGEEYHHITIQQPLHLEKKVFPNLEELSLDGQMFEMIRWSDGQSFWIPSKITQSGKNVQDDEEN
ncbi:probable disease resistance protein At4g27220 isoform X2 [Hevea brasiliensis]|uniref:probable disease resistance protein At4g27220 isoform X2 n=1 Tax=Hevea brasiliensis TaxID=3981 RepID=UPI0025F6F34F|nr:probable disease resistance protein At4g27220 isoform X2 [Hevea brasiliensis]